MRNIRISWYLFTGHLSRSIMIGRTNERTALIDAMIRLLAALFSARSEHHVRHHPVFRGGACAVVFLLGLAVLPALSLAADKDNNSANNEDYERNRSHYYVAMGTAVAPDYEGSAYYEILPLVVARWIKRGAYVELKGATLRANVIQESLWQFGPVFRYNRARGKVGSVPISRMEHIDGAWEAGAFFGALVRDPDRPVRQLGLEVQILQDLSGTHNGYHLDFELAGGVPINDKWSIYMTLNSDYGSNRYMNTYFGVNASDALRSGLQPFFPESGFRDIAFSMAINYNISGHWGIALAGRYQRMLGDAAKSPVVASAGNVNQYVVTLMGTYAY
jgi:outer membrane protein